MTKLIAKLLYPIYRELCELRNKEREAAKWNSVMEESSNAQKEFDDFHGYNDSESVSVDEAQQGIVSGWREGEPRVSAQHSLIDRIAD